MIGIGGEKVLLAGDRAVSDYAPKHHPDDVVSLANFKVDGLFHNDTSLRRAIKKHGFPPGFLMNPGARRWFWRDVAAWLTQRVEASKGVVAPGPGPEVHALRMKAHDRARARKARAAAKAAKRKSRRRRAQPPADQPAAAE